MWIEWFGYEWYNSFGFGFFIRDFLFLESVSFICFILHSWEELMVDCRFDLSIIMIIDYIHDVCVYLYQFLRKLVQPFFLSLFFFFFLNNFRITISFLLEWLWQLFLLSLLYLFHWPILSLFPLYDNSLKIAPKKLNFLPFSLFPFPHYLKSKK